ncbi:hypothetical protein lerEdw1_002758 [Lerista edwardsae]|nr:hypothetical protein lerEdw1_002758 [Lerista edwardsae]
MGLELGANCRVYKVRTNHREQSRVLLQTVFSSEGCQELIAYIGPSVQGSLMAAYTTDRRFLENDNVVIAVVDLADVVQISVEDLNPDHPAVLENHEVTDEEVDPPLKRQRIEINCQDPSIKTICLRLDSIEAKLLALEATCKSLEEKLDLVMNKQHSPIQVPMVAGSPLGATQTCNKVRWCYLLISLTWKGSHFIHCYLEQLFLGACRTCLPEKFRWAIWGNLKQVSLRSFIRDLLKPKSDDIIWGSDVNPVLLPEPANTQMGTCVVPQTTVILNNDRQNSIVAKMVGQEEPLNRAADSLENILSNAVPGRRQNTIVVKVPGHEDSHNEDGESGSEASDSISNSGQLGGQNIGNNVTLITLNSEEDYPSGTWLGDENNPEMRVRCPITAADMLHISTNCRTAEKMALTLLDYLFHREIQAISNLSGQGKHGKKQLDPLMIYGIRCIDTLDMANSC